MEFQPPFCDPVLGGEKKACGAGPTAATLLGTPSASRTPGTHLSLEGSVAGLRAGAELKVGRVSSSALGTPQQVAEDLPTRSLGSPV